MLHSVTVYLLTMCATFRTAIMLKPPLRLLGFQPVTGDSWNGGEPCLWLTHIALDDVNAEPSLLTDYTLNYTWFDSKCHPGAALYGMTDAIYSNPPYVMLLGAACSPSSSATAQVSYMWNLTQLSYGSSSPILSDRTRFPRFFRLTAPEQQTNPSRIAVMQKFNWNRVATLNQALEFFSMVIDDFVLRINNTGISVISQEIFHNNPMSRVQNLKMVIGIDLYANELKKKGNTYSGGFQDFAFTTFTTSAKRDARIILTASYEDKAREIICAAYKVGLYGPKIVWIFAGWFATTFWRDRPDSVPCTLEQMELVVEGSMLFSFIYRNPKEIRGLIPRTANELYSSFHEHPMYNVSYSKFEFVVGLCYDHIWAAALALNCTDTALRKMGHVKTLDEFTYADGDINDVITACMGSTSFSGTSGEVVFEEGADPRRDVSIEMIRDGVRRPVGVYIMDKEPYHLEEINGGIQWTGGVIPRDSTYISRQEVHLPQHLYIIMTSLAGLGIVVAVLLLAFNVRFRNNRYVKLSSPNINSILLLGCITCYMTVFLNTTATEDHRICKARTFCLSLGFTTAFGSLFSKTWRVYRIFTNKKLLRRTIKDSQLLMIIGIMVGVVLVVLVAWEIVGPQRLIIIETEVHYMSNDAEIHPFVRVCHSDWSSYFSWGLYVLEGSLLVFGAFLAWETRGVTIEALNDSHQIGMCLYNVIALSAVGLTLTLLLEKQAVLVYGVTSGCLIIGTTITPLVVFVPKMLAVYRNPAVGPADLRTLHTVTGTQINTRGLDTNTTMPGPSSMCTKDSK